MERRILFKSALGLGAATILSGAFYRNPGFHKAAQYHPVAKLSPKSCGKADCILSPESMEGPYFIDESLVRSDIREDRKGLDFNLTVEVASHPDCFAIKNASVEIWHCDSQGYYSGHLDKDPNVEAEDDHHIPPTDPSVFLRGTQFSDSDGFVNFKTKFPGWYAGRAIHIHIKVSLSSSEVYTGQLYFDEFDTKSYLESSDHYFRPPGHAIRLKNDEDYIFSDANGSLTTVRSNLITNKKAEGFVRVGIPNTNL